MTRLLVAALNSCTRTLLIYIFPTWKFSVRFAALPLTCSIKVGSLTNWSQTSFLMKNPRPPVAAEAEQLKETWWERLRSVRNLSQARLFPWPSCTRVISCFLIRWSLVRFLRLVSAPGAPISPLAFQVTIESLETPRGKRLQKSPVGSDGGFGLLGSGGFAFFQLFGELLGDAFRWDAESFGGDWLPDWLGEL